MLIQEGILIALIVMAWGISIALARMARRGELYELFRGRVRSDVESRVLTRIDELERRLNDIQDVVIAIDEKLDRIKRRLETQQDQSG